MGKRVQRIGTNVSELQMVQAIVEAWKELFGFEPSKEQISLVLAQNALETGHRKNMWNYNIGNLTTDGKSQYNFYDDITTKEQVKPGLWESKNLKYRAYPNLKEGVKDYLKLLSSKKYLKAWKHILNPNPEAFSKSLKDIGYYTANEQPYTKAITKLYNKFNKSNIYPRVILPNSEVANKTQSLDNILNKYLQQVTATEKINRKLYKKYLPANNLLIKVYAADYTDKIEFARILSNILEEELLAKAYTYTNGSEVEINCNIPGPHKDCLSAVNSMVESTAETFKIATNKLGGIDITASIYVDKQSAHDKLTFNTADQQYRKFLLKFATKGA